VHEGLLFDPYGQNNNKSLSYIDLLNEPSQQNDDKPTPKESNRKQMVIQVNEVNEKEDGEEEEEQQNPEEEPRKMINFYDIAERLNQDDGGDFVDLLNDDDEEGDHQAGVVNNT